MNEIDPYEAYKKEASSGGKFLKFDDGKTYQLRLGQIQLCKRVFEKKNAQGEVQTQERPQWKALVEVLEVNGEKLEKPKLWETGSKAVIDFFFATGTGYRSSKGVGTLESSPEGVSILAVPSDTFIVSRQGSSSNTRYMIAVMRSGASAPSSYHDVAEAGI